MEMVLYAGGHSYSDTPDKNSKIPLFYQKEFDLPLVEGCAGWLVCKVIPNEENEKQHNLFMGKLSEHGVMTAFSKMGTGFLMMHQMSYVLSITLLADSFTPLAKGQNLIMVREKTNPYFYINVAI